MGLGQKLQFATRRNKTNQIRIRKRELDASNNRSFASEIVSSDYEVTALIQSLIIFQVATGAKISMGFNNVKSIMGVVRGFFEIYHQKEVFLTKMHFFHRKMQFKKTLTCRFS